MGYRSDVAYIIMFETIEQRDTYANSILARGPDDELHMALLECDYERKDLPAITFHATDVKWYESYSDVQAHRRLYRDASEVIPTAEYRCVELGEDGNEEVYDSSVSGDLYQYIDTVHELRVSF